MEKMCGYLKHSFNHKLKDLYFMWWQTKLTAVNTNLVKTQKLELQTLQWVFLLLLPRTSLLCSIMLLCVCILIYNFILHIEYLCRLIVLSLKDCDYSLPRNLAWATKFYWLICEKSGLFILLDSLALSDLLHTLIESAHWIMDQRVITISNTTQN